MRSALAVSSNGPPGSRARSACPSRSLKLSTVVARCAVSSRDQPVDDPLEARPPEGPGAGARQHRRRNARARSPAVPLAGILGQLARKSADEFGERRVDADAEIGAAGIGVELVERLQFEDMAGIDRVGVAEPGLDLGDRQPARPRGERRARRGAAAAAGIPRRRAVRPRPAPPDRARARRRGRPRAARCRAASSQRDGTVGTPSLRAARVSATSGAAIAWAKSCAAMPIARSGTAISNSRRICRDIHGSCAAGPGQVPSLSPPRTTRSACCSRASTRPQIASRGMAAIEPGGRPRRRPAPRTGPGNGGPAAAGNRRAASISSWQKRAAVSPAASRHSRSPPVSSSVAASRSAASICAVASRASGTASAASKSGRAPRQASSRSAKAPQPVGIVAGEGGSETGEAGRRARPADRLFEPPGQIAERRRGEPAGGQRMLQRRQQRHRGELARGEIEDQAQKHAGRRAVQRQTGRIVDRRCPSARSSAATRRASSRSGVTSAAVAPGVSSLRRSSSAIVSASSCAPAQS